MGGDLVFAARTLRRQPLFTAAAVLTIAIGVGATTALFSTVNAALLRPLPFPRSRDLFTLRTSVTGGGFTSGAVASVELEALNPPTGAIMQAGGMVAASDTIIDDPTRPLQITIGGVTPSYFETFGLPMLAGRGFAAGEFVETAPTRLVLSAHLWRAVFHADPTIVGKPVHLSRGGLLVVGVAPAEIGEVDGTDAWWNYISGERSISHIFTGYMRTRPGASPRAVDDELTRVAAQLGREFPVFNANRVFVTRPLVDAIVGDLKPTLIIALAATVLLLLLACVNVTNLLLARSTARSREVAIRAALGAGRWRIVRQLAIESLLLALAGAAIGIAIARAGVRVLLAIAGSRLPRLDAVPFDARVLSFAIAVTVVTAVAVALTPAIRLIGADITALMNDGGRTATSGPGTPRALALMTVAEIAVALTLVAGAGWLIQNFHNLQTERPGFSAERRLVFDVLLPPARYPDAASVGGWNDRLLDAIRALPGVSAAGSASSLPLHVERDNTASITIAGDPPQEFPPSARARSVTPGWFEAMNVRLEAGRPFTRDDQRPGAPQVAIVNGTFVQRYLRGRDALRERLMPISSAPNAQPRQIAIVGVVDDVKYGSLSAPPEPTIYTTETPFRRETVVVATASPDPVALVPALRAAVKRLDPLIPVDFELMPHVVAASLSRQRTGMMLMAIFGLAALTLAAVGIYGVIAYAVSMRAGEMATRMALGAAPSDVFWLVWREGGLLAIAGVAVGVGIAATLGRIVTSQLYEVSARDPIVLGAATAIVIGITAAAVSLPALGASAINPADTFRNQ
jgi:putative ABC transport system permease protein